MTLPPQLYSAAQVRQLEGRLIAAGTPGPVLMERAGAAAYACLRARWPAVTSIAVVCGGGNNGGDGQVVARLAQADGLAVRVFSIGSAQPETLQRSQLQGCELIVDALLGIGMRAPLSAQMVSAIEAINGAGVPVLAMDLPSGLDPDSGKASAAVHATATITFIGLKTGLFVGDGPEHAGEVVLETLGAKDADIPPALLRLTDADLSHALPPRPRQSHKGLFGKVVVIGGGAGMPGAVRLAAEAALRVGAGLVTVASRPEHLQIIVGARPELMFHSLANGRDVSSAVAGADVVLIGPGLGRDDWAREVLATTFAEVAADKQLVVDADALNLVAEGVGRQRSDQWILTPHPAEAARLLRISTSDVQADRMSALRSLCEQCGGTIVLKGATTLVGNGSETTRVCDRGNPGMAVAGMGDVLAGAIAGILAQDRKPFLAALAAVHAHATAGDNCARTGLRGIVAMDVALELRTVLAALP